MKIKHRFRGYFYLFSAVFLLFCFNSCNLVDGKKEYRTYTILKGFHTSHLIPTLYKGKELRFLAKFDHTAIYTSKDPINQEDVNKLYGFSDCGDKHHINSARFAWRWYSNRLEIFAYCYVNRERQSQYLTTVELEKEYEYKIYITENKYVFTLNGVSLVMNRGCFGDGEKYYLFPYFGGDESAPHDVHVSIKELE